MHAAPYLLALLTTTTVLAGCTADDASSSSEDRVAAQLHSAYNDHPFMGGQMTPDHEWSFVNAGKEEIAFLHWMGTTHAGHSISGDAEKGDHLFATGDGFKGRWCRGDDGVTQEQIDAGFVHFHKESAANWDAGHGGSSASQVGFWLRHVAAQSGVEMMPGVKSVAGEVYPLMPSTGNLPAC